MKNKVLVEKLKRLKNLEVAGRPQDSWVSQSRDILMSQIRPQDSKVEAVEEKVYYWQYFSNTFKKNVFRPVMTFVIILGVMLGYNVTVNVANASLPGDILYPIKTVSEQFQLAITFNEDKKVGLQMDFVSRRVSELSQILMKIEEKTEKVKNISETAKKITYDTKDVKEKMGKISMALEKTELIKQIDSKATEISKDMAKVKDSLTDDIKNEVNGDIDEALDSAEEVGDITLAVLVEKHKNGDIDVSDEDVTAIVKERIETVEDTIISVENSVKVVASSTVEVISSDNVLLSSTTTAKLIESSPQQAKDKIIEAKSLLEQKDFSSALEKIQESKNIVEELNQIKDNEENTIKEDSNQVLGTSTEAILNKVEIKASTSSTAETSENNKEIINQSN